MKFKIGDKVTPKPGGFDIWIKAGVIYEVLDLMTEPEQPPKRMKRWVYPGVEADCTKPAPEKYYLKVKNEYGKEGFYLEECFITGIEPEQN